MATYVTGCSGATREKWKRHGYLMQVHAEMCRLIMMKCLWCFCDYLYFDFFAGPGLYRESDHVGLDGEYGSPVRALRILSPIFRDRGELAANGQPLGLRTFFHDPKVADRLRACLADLDIHGGCVGDLPCEVAVPDLAGRWAEVAGRSPGKPLGLAFFDPNGCPPWGTIKKFAETPVFNRIDLLINVNSTAGKRVLKSPVHAETLTPTQHLAGLGKSDVYLWEPASGDNHQFALAYCTNADFPEFKRLGFHFLHTERGRRIANRMDMTTKERISLGGTTGFLRGMEDV